MMRTYLRLTLFAVIFWSYLPLHAQDEADIYVQIGPEDARKLVEDYMRPLYNSIGYGFTSGWYTTAATHDRWGFDFTINVSLVYVPSQDLTFRFQNSDYEKIQVVGTDEAYLPTVFGPQNKAERPELSVMDDNGEMLVRLTAPPGAVDLKKEIGVNAVPLPMYQFGLGVIKHTDIKVRVLPKINFDGGSVSMLGFGVQHDIAQWIRLLDAQDISIAFLGAYNSMTSKVDLSEEDDPETAGNEGVFKMNGMNLQFIASREYFKVFTFVGGVGYSRAGSRTQVLGTYPIDEKYTQIPDDPLDLQYGNSSMNLSLGLRIKLLFITVAASHTFQKYQVSTASLGITFR